MLRTRKAAEPETDSVDHVRQQQQHKDYVTPGAGQLSLNQMIPPYPRWSKHGALRKVGRSPRTCTDLQFPGPTLTSLPMSAAAAQLFTIYCLQGALGQVRYGTHYCHVLIHPFLSTVSDS